MTLIGQYKYGVPHDQILSKLLVEILKNKIK